MQKTTEEKAAILESIYQESIKNEGSMMLKSISHGEPIDAWNFIECNRQNAEEDKVGEVQRMECMLCYESGSVAEFFRGRGFDF
jgi:hypothetical protein